MSYRHWLCGLLVGLLPAAGQTPSTVPPAYQDLYDSLTSYLQSFNGLVNAGWNRSTPPVTFAAQLTTASTNAGPKLISPDYYANSVVPELTELKALGVKAVLVAMNYPILSPGFHGNASTYQAFVNFYKQLAADVHARGLKLVGETGATLSQAGFTPWNVGSYYTGLTLNQYEGGRSQQVTTIAQQIRPDYLTVISEPDTEATQTGFAEIGTLSESTAMLNKMMSGLRQAGVQGVSIGAGVGSWTPAYQSWFDSFAGAGVQYIDIHVFPVNRTFLTDLPAMADYAASLGKPLACSQCWLAKQRDSELGTLNYGQVAARDPFSFWAPLDGGFVQAMARFAYWKHMLFFSPFWTIYFHTYLDYGATSSLSPSQIVGLATTRAAQAIATAQYTTTATAYGSAVTIPADTAAPSVPGGLSGRPFNGGVYLTWNAATDNVGVAGYSVYRNGVRLGTTVNTFYYDAGLLPKTTYTFAVSAYDGRPKSSANSAPVAITTP